MAKRKGVIYDSTHGIVLKREIFVDNLIQTLLDVEKWLLAGVAAGVAWLSLSLSPYAPKFWPWCRRTFLWRVERIIQERKFARERNDNYDFARFGCDLDSQLLVLEAELEAIWWPVPHRVQRWTKCKRKQLADGRWARPWWGEWYEGLSRCCVLFVLAENPAAYARTRKWRMLDTFGPGALRSLESHGVI